MQKPWQRELREALGDAFLAPPSRLGMFIFVILVQVVVILRDAS